MAEQKKPAVVFVLGGPGSGKGTQCAKLVEQFGFVHLSAGDLLREERKRGGKNAELIESIIQDGKIVPSEITVGLLKQAIETNGLDRKYLIDGFPRSQENLDGWQSTVDGIVDFRFVLFFDCSVDTMTKRVIKRSEGSGRSDDNIESLLKRFNTYNESTQPIIEHYNKQNKVVKIDAEQTVDAIYDIIKPHFAAI